MVKRCTLELDRVVPIRGTQPCLRLADILTHPGRHDVIDRLSTTTAAVLRGLLTHSREREHGP
jgi:hypothetical protein